MFSDLMYILSDKLKDMSLFSDVIPMARLVRSEGNTFPVVYMGEGQGKPLNWDQTSGMCYFRKRGAVSFSQNTDRDFKITSCDNSVVYDISIPLRLVVFINAGKADCNNEFSSDFFAEWIIGDISGGLNITGIREASLIATNIETDSIAVLNSEYSNASNIGDINYEYCYLYIDFNLKIIANQACLNSCVNPIVQSEFITGSLAMQPYKVAQSPHTTAKYGTLIGVVNGINKIFTVPEGVFEDDTNIVVIYSGQFTGDFTAVKATGTVTTNFTPGSGRQITIMYI
jgi:hypothetical protein